MVGFELTNNYVSILFMTKMSDYNSVKSSDLDEKEVGANTSRQGSGPST